MKKKIYLYLLSVLMLGSSIAKGQSIVSANMYQDTSCLSSTATVNITGCIGGLKLLTYYGDGTMDSLTVSCSGSASTLTPFYPYGVTGNYTVKHVLKNNFTHFDSATYSHYYKACSQKSLEAWADLNGNCILDAADRRIVAPGLIRVDSAGVPVDTITAYSSLNYRIYGPPGTIYTYTAVILPIGMVSCPSMSVIYDTVPTSPYGHIPKYWLLQCSSSTSFDLGISASFWPALAGSGANKAHLLVYNSTCTSTAATVKFEFGPKFSFASIYPPVSYTVTGTSVVFDAGTVTSTVPKSYSIKLTPVATLTVGDTVNTKFTVFPTTGDIYTSNNMVIRCDTVLGS